LVVKKSLSGSIYKARFVIKGCQQVADPDYRETYSPTLNHKSFRLVIASAAICDMELLQLDIKSAFLCGKVNERVYSELPTIVFKMILAGDM
jgi:Reverse transcriptase (RNA-dependent DNA polymerase)